MNILQILRHPRAAVVIHDLFMVGVSWLAAGWIFHRSGIPLISQSQSLFMELAIVLIIQGLVLWSTGLYKGLWRFASFPDLWNIARAALYGTILIMAALAVMHGAEVQKVLGAVLIYPGALFLTLGLPRMCFRFWKDAHLPASTSVEGLQRVLVLGAGRSGAMLERELRHRGAFDVIGFLDDDDRLRGAQVHGVLPTEALEDQRCQAGAARAEHDGRDGHALGVLPVRRDGRAFGAWRREPAVRVGAGDLVAVLVGQARLPRLALPGRPLQPRRHQRGDAPREPSHG